MLVPATPKNVLICAVVPVTVNDEVPLPATPAPLLPAVALSVPSTTESVTVIRPAPASTSLIDKPLPLSIRLTCSGTVKAVCVIVATGASLTAITVIATVSTSCSLVAFPLRPGSVPVLPLSLVVIVSVSPPLKFSTPL